MKTLPEMDTSPFKIHSHSPAPLPPHDNVALIHDRYVRVWRAACGAAAVAAASLRRPAARPRAPPCAAPVTRTKTQSRPHPPHHTMSSRLYTTVSPGRHHTLIWLSQATIFLKCCIYLLMLVLGSLSSPQF